MVGTVLAGLAGVAAGYGFRGWIRRHLGVVGDELKADLKKLHDKLEEILPKLEAAAQTDVKAILDKIKAAL